MYNTDKISFNETIKLSKLLRRFQLMEEIKDVARGDDFSYETKIIKKVVTKINDYIKGELDRDEMLEMVQLLYKFQIVVEGDDIYHEQKQVGEVIKIIDNNMK